MSTPKCCYIPPEFQGKSEESPWCDLPCNWEIRNADDPDPHSNDTYACDKHLSELLNMNNSVHHIGTSVGYQNRDNTDAKRITSVNTVREFVNSGVTYGVYSVTMNEKQEIFIRNGDSIGQFVFILGNQQANASQ